MASYSKGKECIIKRDLKRARAFEIRKLIRKIKVYNNKRGEEQQVEKYKRKSQRLVDEMEAIKDMDLDGISKSINDGISKYSLSEPPTDTYNRARQRILTSKCIQHLLVNSNPNAEEEVATIQAISGAEPCNGDSRSDEQLASTDDRVEDTDHAIHGNKRQDTPDSRGTVQVGSRRDKRLLLQQLRKSKRKTRELEKYRKKTNNYIDQIDKGSAKNNMVSTFVGSLSGTKRHNTRKTMNRMGQRARRQMWETKYKEMANHITKNAGKNPAKKFNYNRTSKIPAKKSNYNRTTTEKHRTIKETSANGSGDGQTVESLHPSWEASRLRKQQQSVNLKTFQGSKIVFSDSD